MYNKIREFEFNKKMSLRKFMHERNKYKDEPNFKELAILYPEFRKISMTDITGKIRINFKDEESLKILTKTLLKHDFNLEVDIPPKKLVPALPLRLNYILWIEDLLKHSGFNDLSNVHGLDIGTGAICIYPLLFSKMFNCKMTCTDIDEESVKSAIENIKNNNLQHLIKVILVKKELILKELLEDNVQYSFLMCNPPFFETDKGLGRKIKQEPPRNASTGNENELKVKGGEREFILRLIYESLKYKDKVKIYTTMFGQKSSLAFLRNELTKNGILNATWTEFCQGFTKRWGIAWTFVSKNEINLIAAPVIRTRTEVLKMKKNKSMEIIFPAKEKLNCLKHVVFALKQWIAELKIKIKEIQVDDDYLWACQLIGYNDTWTHARRKRRMAMRQQALKKQCLENPKIENNTEQSQIEHIHQLEPTTNENKNMEISQPLLVCTLLVGEKNENDDSDGNSDEHVSDKEETDEKIFTICMLFESGHGGKLSLETLRQYLVNKLNIREFFHKQHRSKPNKKNRKKKKLISNNFLETHKFEETLDSLNS